VLKVQLVSKVPLDQQVLPDRQEAKELLVIQAAQVVKALLDNLGTSGHPELRVQLVKPVNGEIRDSRDLLGLRARLDHKVLLGTLEHKVSKVPMEHLG